MRGQQREATTTAAPAWKSPLALSLTLHLLILGVALAGWSWTSPVEQAAPRSISARLITQQAPEPSPVVDSVDQQQRNEARLAEEQRRREEAERQRQADEARRVAEQKRQEAEAKARAAQQARAEEAARQKAEADAKARARQKAEEEKRRQDEARRKAEEEKRRQEEQRQREEAERRRQEELARQEAERRLREQQLEAQAEAAQQARAEQARRQQEAAAAKAREARMLSESEKYQALIRERLSQAWYPPSSATPEMTARLQITLLPTGELVGARLVSSSGNTAFDNSALGAVRSLSRYPIPSGRAIFERYFRQFTIEFNPRRLR